LLQRPNGLALSCAAPIDRETVEPNLAFKIDAILGPHSGVGWNAIFGGGFSLPASAD